MIVYKYRVLIASFFARKINFSENKLYFSVLQKVLPVISPLARNGITGISG